MANPAANVVMGTAGEVVLDSTAISNLTQWTLTDTQNVSEWGDSDSLGCTNRKGARRDATGSEEGKLNTAAEIYDTVNASAEPEQTCWINATLYYNFPCVVFTNFKLTVNTDSKEVVGWSVDFGAAGVFYRPGEANAPSKTYPV